MTSPRPAEPPERGVAGDSGTQTEILEALSGAVNYRRWLADLAVPHLGDDALEIGSGLGDYAAEWAERGIGITASEADPTRLGRLRARFARDPRVAVRELTAPITETGEHSAVVAYNVLEHIEDDVAALRSFAGLVRPGGRIVLIVPAFEVAMSDFDRAIGHFRRYRRGSLAERLTAAELEIERLHYVNAIGLVAWIVMMRLLRQRPREGPALTAWDRLVIPPLRRLESLRPPPFGQSVFAVAVRSEAPGSA